MLSDTCQEMRSAGDEGKMTRPIPPLAEVHRTLEEALEYALHEAIQWHSSTDYHSRQSGGDNMISVDVGVMIPRENSGHCLSVPFRCSRSTNHCKSIISPRCFQRYGGGGKVSISW